MDSISEKELPISTAPDLATKRYLIIANPHSGRRQCDTAIETVQSRLNANRCEADLLMTVHANHARQIARETCLDGYTGLCFIGGDGTLHEVVCGLLERNDNAQIPIGILPGGTGNDVAGHLGIKEIHDAIGRVVAGQTRTFDVAKVNSSGETYYCTALVGWNAVAEINRLAEQFRRLGLARYALAAMLQIIQASPLPATLVLDDEEITDEFLLVAACNTPVVGGGMRLAPRAVTDDGKFDVIVIRRASRWQMLQLFMNVFSGKHVAMNGVEYYQTRRLEIVADDPRPLDIDGEVKGAAPFAMEVLSNHLQVFC